MEIVAGIQYHAVSPVPPVDREAIQDPGEPFLKGKHAGFAVVARTDVVGERPRQLAVVAQQLGTGRRGGDGVDEGVLLAVVVAGLQPSHLEGDQTS